MVEPRKFPHLLTNGNSRVSIIALWRSGQRTIHLPDYDWHENFRGSDDCGLSHQELLFPHIWDVATQSVALHCCVLSQSAR